MAEANLHVAPGVLVAPWRPLRTRESRVALSVLVLGCAMFVAQVTVLGATTGRLLSSVVVAALLTSVVAYGQGVAILSGGFDLSIPWTMTLGGVLLTHFADGSDSHAVWTVPAVLAVGALIGAVNGLGIVFLRLPPIVATLAMNVILEGLVLVYTGGTPRGFSPPAISSLMTGSVLGTIVPSALVLLVVLWLLGSFLLTGTTLGRSIYAVGDNGRVAFLSGVNVPFVLCAVYAISGCAAALGGILLTGYSGQSALAMGDPYLLPSIAAVILGGASVLGGRGIYSGTVAGALFLSAMQALLQSFNVSSAFRTIIFGVVIVVSASILQLSRLQDTRAGRAFGDLLIKTFHRQREYVVSRWWRRI